MRSQYAPKDSPEIDLSFYYVGIILHVEKSGADAPRRLVFRKANTNVVHIGRRSADSDSDFPRGDNELSGGAMFRCAVVSRKHAKIAFSDSGPVSAELLCVIST